MKRMFPTHSGMLALSALVLVSMTQLMACGAPEETPTPDVSPTEAPETPTSAAETPTLPPETPTLTPDTPTLTPETPTLPPETPTLSPETPTLAPTPTATPLADGDGDGFAESDGDCNDENASINPNAEEVCDGVDNDCSSQVDGADALDLDVYYLDSDGDGYGTGSDTTEACEQPEGYAVNSGDCNDTDSTVNPGLAEVCDGKDQDCDEQLDDDPTDGTVYFLDADQDGYGTQDSFVRACTKPEGYASNNSDCNDSSALVNPAQPEINYDGIDNDCSGSDEVDVDDDGVSACEVASAPCDCDDEDPEVNPNVTEVVDNSIDDDCDALIDEGGTRFDDDGDTFTEQQGDCNDGDPTINPDAVELETCDTVDQDCDGLDLDATCLDSDSDGFSPSQGDCDDTLNTSYPGATEVFDGKDNDCDALQDEGVVPVGALIFTEVLSDAAGDENKGEWFEILNTSPYAIDLFNFEFKDNASKFTVKEHVRVAAGAYATLGNCGDVTSNGGVAHDYVYATCSSTGVNIQLSNSPSTSSPERLEVYDAPSGRAIDKISITDIAKVNNSSSGVSRSLDPDSLDTVANDATTLGAIWCAASPPTPKAANGQCVVPN